MVFYSAILIHQAESDICEGAPVMQTESIQAYASFSETYPPAKHSPTKPLNLMIRVILFLDLFRQGPFMDLGRAVVDAEGPDLAEYLLDHRIAA